MRTRGLVHGRGLDLRSRPATVYFLFRRKAGPQRPRKTQRSGARLSACKGMAGLRSLVLRPWIRELILGSETLSSPRAGQLLQVSPSPLSGSGIQSGVPGRWD